MHGSPVHEAAAKTRLPKNFFPSLFQSAFIQNCQRCAFYRSPKDWFYTVYTHYSHSLLKPDPVTHIFPAAGPPSLDVPPACHPSVWSLTKEKQRDRGKHSSAKQEKDVSKYDSVISGKGVRRREKRKSKDLRKSNQSKRACCSKVNYIILIIRWIIKVEIKKNKL